MRRTRSKQDTDAGGGEQPVERRKGLPGSEGRARWMVNSIAMSAEGRVPWREGSCRKGVAWKPGDRVSPAKWEPMRRTESAAGVVQQEQGGLQLWDCSGRGRMERSAGGPTTMGEVGCIGQVGAERGGGEWGGER